MRKEGLDFFFNADSVAVIGASADEGKAGNQIVKNLLSIGYEGKVFPIHPKVKEIYGCKCYPNLTAVPEKIELIVICIPDFGVPPVIREAADRKDVKAAVIVSAGFSETKIPERVALEEEILDICKEAGIRVFGPNCVGVMNNVTHLDTTFVPSFKKTYGKISYISQSGATGASILIFGSEQPVPIGFNKWAHVGNMSDVDILEILEYYEKDDETKVIAMYMEGVENGKEFLAIAKKATKQKPLVILKVGRSEVGSQAAASHTGSLAGTDNIYEGAFKQFGVTRVYSIDELLDTAKTFATQPMIKGRKVCVLTEAGGPGIICMDEIGLSEYPEMAMLSEETVEKLKEILPPMAIVNRPEGYIDMSAAALEKAHAEALEIVLEDEGVDAVILISVPPSFVDADELADEVIKVAKNSKKPVLTCLMAGERIKNARIKLEENDLPTYDLPNKAAKALSNMIKRKIYLDKLSKEV